ncbi:hypothetical protein [Raineyella sp. W15-4]|uniref:hypothetical protein n=1 Tax=Raineyella sp. W15-4 TaxID=3081651 RepID=UPI00295583F7|nr:hypothetical protein [Raineyella sp. W15-4]WOQ16964.1 hypothetical protein R0145_17455 [Raineyella sp. W15-4]
MDVGSVRVFRWSVASTVAAQFVNIVYGLILPRLVILVYGSEVNGVMASGLQLVGYLAILEAGLTAASINQLYKPISGGDVDEVGNLLGTVRLSYVRIAVLVASGAVLLAGLYSLVVRSSLSPVRVFLFVVALAVGPVIDFSLSSKFYVYFVASNQVFKFQRAQIVAMVGKVAVVLVVSRLRLDPLILFTLLSLISLVKAAILRFDFWREPFNVPRRYVRRKIPQRGAVLSHQLLGLVTYNLPVILISVGIGVMAGSVFSVNSMIFGTFYGFGSMVYGQVFVPRLGHSIVSGSRKTDYFYRRSVLAGTWFSTCAMLSTFVLLPSFLNLYVGGSDINYYYRSTASLFAMAGFFNILKLPYQSLVTASGKFRETVVFSGIEAGVFLAVVLATWWWRSIDLVALALVLSSAVKMFSLKIFSHFAIAREPLSQTAGQLLALASIGLCLWILDPSLLQFDSVGSWLVLGSIVFVTSSLVALTVTTAPGLLVRMVKKGLFEKKSGAGV